MYLINALFNIYFQGSDILVLITHSAKPRIMN